MRKGAEGAKAKKKKKHLFQLYNISVDKTKTWSLKVAHKSLERGYRGYLQLKMLQKQSELHKDRS